MFKEGGNNFVDYCIFITVGCLNPSVDVLTRRILTKLQELAGDDQ